MSREAARARQELRRSNAAVPIPSRKTHRPADRLRDELDSTVPADNDPAAECPRCESRDTYTVWDGCDDAPALVCGACRYGT